MTKTAAQDAEAKAMPKMIFEILRLERGASNPRVRKHGINKKKHFMVLWVDYKPIIQNQTLEKTMKRVSEATGQTFTRFTRSNLTEKSFSRMVNGEVEEVKVRDGIPAGESHFKSAPDGPAWRQGALEDHSFKAKIRSKLEREAAKRRVKADKIEADLKAENSKRKRLAEADRQAEIVKAQAAVVDSRPNVYADARVDRILRNRDKRELCKKQGITGIRKAGKTIRLVKAKGIGATKQDYKQACKNAAAKIEFEGRNPSENLMPAKGRVWAVEKNGNVLRDHQNPKTKNLAVRPQHTL